MGVIIKIVNWPKKIELQGQQGGHVGMQPLVCSNLGNLQLGDSLSKILAAVSRSLF